MGFLVPLAAAGIGAIGSAVGGAATAIGGGLSSLGGFAASALGGGAAGAGAGGAGSILGGLSSTSGLLSTGLSLATSLSSPKAPAPMMAPPVQAIPNPPRNSNNSFAALATPSNQTSFGAPSTGRVKTLLGQ